METSACWMGEIAALETRFMSSAKVQLDALTGARGLAAWYVVVYHIREAFGPEVPAGVIAFFAKGYLAVDLFFILSGFVMWLTYGAKFERDGLRAAPDFLWRRLARIYPLHLFILAAMTAFALLLVAAGKGDAARFPFAELPLHILLVQNWGFTSALSWNDPAWSISTEMGAYLALPIVANLLVRWRGSAMSNLAFAASLCGVLTVVLGWAGAQHLGDKISELGLIRCLLQFFLGIAVCRIWQSTQPQRLSTFAALATLIAGAVALGWAAGGLTEIMAVPALFAATVYLLAASSGWKANPLNSRVALHLGDISYSTYLVHFFAWILFKLVFVADVNAVPLWMMAGFALATYAASVALYHGIEVPGRKLVQGWNPFGGRPPVAVQSH